MLLRKIGIVLIVSFSGIACNAMAVDHQEQTSMGWPVPMSSQASWQLLPKATSGQGQDLPTWARMLSRELPNTTAAFLELDLAHRTRSPVEPGLRAAMRWISANANHCEYAKATAKADALRSGVTYDKWTSLENNDLKLWSDDEKAALDFALKMTLDSDSVTDDAFADLVKRFSDRKVAAMVLLLAYSNFQDRLLVCLGAPLEEGGALPPVDVHFPQDIFMPPHSASAPPAGATKKPVFELPGDSGQSHGDLVQDDKENTWLAYPELQKRLQQQREKKTRLPSPPWSQTGPKLPPGLMDEPSTIVWYQIAMGYAHELAVPFELYLQTAGREISVNWDRPFGNCLFWMVTDAVKCPYCMGHCEMNWEVVGFNSQQIAELSGKLAGNDWSSFLPGQQRALAFARKLTLMPGQIDRKDMDTLRADFGDQRAFFIALNCSRYNYMTRISNGFQLTLEEGNPFWAYYGLPTPKTGSK